MPVAVPRSLDEWRAAEAIRGLLVGGPHGECRFDRLEVALLRGLQNIDRHPCSAARRRRGSSTSCASTLAARFELLNLCGHFSHLRREFGRFRHESDNVYLLAALALSRELRR